MREQGPSGFAVPESISVSQLNRQVAALLERSFPLIWVSGELSNFVRAASGHCYFTLKDAGAQVRGVMFRSRARALEFAPREGDRVEVLAQVSLYEARGDFQLGVEQMRRAGAGDLYREFTRLRAKLEAEGLFAAERKRAVPPLPGAIGVVTSPHAAALRDVLTTLARRAPQVPVILYPTPVQGADAPEAIAAALDAANRRAETDVLLLVRGGGSIEDLWSFNDERVARAVHRSRIPVIAGVGHESDVTIADFVADLRAPTPTGAAMLAATDRRELLDALARLGAGLQAVASRGLRAAEQRLDVAIRLLKPPSAKWAERAHRLQVLARALAGVQSRRIDRAGVRLERAASALAAPGVDALQFRAQALASRLARAMDHRADAAAQRVEAVSAQLALVSPEAVLDRGYAIVFDPAGRVLRDAGQAPAGTRIEVRLARGELAARVEPASARGAERPGQ